MARRPPPPEALDRHTLEHAARLLLGEEFKRPLAVLLGPHHPDGPRPSLDPRLPFRWFAPPFHEDGTENRGHRPIPMWVWPVIREMLHQHSLDLASMSREAQRLNMDIAVLVDRAGKK